MLFTFRNLSKVKCLLIIPNHSLIESVLLCNSLPIIYAIFIPFDDRLMNLLHSQKIVNWLKERKDNLRRWVRLKKFESINVRCKCMCINQIYFNILFLPKLNLLLWLRHRSWIGLVFRRKVFNLTFNTKNTDLLSWFNLFLTFDSLKFCLWI